MIYVDSSVLVKRYVDETDSDPIVDGNIQHAPDLICIVVAIAGGHPSFEGVLWLCRRDANGAANRIAAE